MTAANAAAQETGSIRGKVLDDSGDYGFQGARVEIKTLDRSTTTGRQGQYLFRNVPVGSYSINVNYLGAATEQIEVNVTAGETVMANAVLDQSVNEFSDMLVTGQAAGKAAAVNRERSAISNIEVLSSDAIGDFPDQNVAEALARVPGLSVARDQGEGRFAVIRGISPNFNSTTINGVQVPSPENDTRAVNLDVIGSGLTESVEVTKSVTPDMSANAIGGNIEISTLNAFDLGNSTSFSLEGSHEEVSGETSPRVEFTTTRLFDVLGGTDNFGIAASVNYFDREFAVHNIESGVWAETESPSNGGTFRAAQEMEHRDYVLNRERLGGTVSFDYSPNPNSEYYLRTVYSEVEEFENELENPYKFEDGNLTALDDNGATFEDGAIERVGKSSTGTQQIYNVQLGGKNELDDWTLEYSTAYSEASDETPDTMESVWLGEGLTMGYDVSGNRKKPDLFVEGEGNDASTYQLDAFEDEDETTEEEQTSLQFDAKRDILFAGNPSSVKFGAQARMVEKTNDLNLTVYDDFERTLTLDEFNWEGVDFPLGTFGPTPNNAQVREFFNENPDVFNANENETAIESRLEDYTLDEDIFAAYLMSESEIGRLSVLGGLRVEHTDVTQTGTQFTVNENVDDGAPQFEDLKADKSYTDFFPNLQMRYRFNDRFEMRGAITQTIARPGFEDAAARQAIEIEGSGADQEKVAEVGNPELDPLHSTNFDIEGTYYAGEGLGLVSAGLFYKQIDDFFVSTNVAGEPPFEDFDEVSQVVNGDTAEVLGLELNWVQQFGFLPSPYDGLIMTANYTRTDSEADVPFRDESIRLPKQAENIANASIGYDKYGISTRLAAQYRDDYFDEVEEPGDPAQDRFAGENLRFDLNTQIRIVEGWHATFNVINITEEPEYWYRGKSRYNSQYDQIGRTIEAGIKARF
ncbi:TonB-dependent receptor [Vreelandella utahensis]|uniref:TonB-dependent receptor n=1 Tax=Vreelandella halophila TaxID=86177 RepID=UPI0015C2F7A6|nr:TonB-dependent receptor [Halomonas utahensis]